MRILLRIIIVCAVILIPTFGLDSHLESKPLIQSLSTSQQWLSLLHFRGKESLINQKSGFFLSSDGSKNAQNELLVTINTMLEDASLAKEGEESTFCRYPARAMFLSQFIPEIKKGIKLIRCDSFMEFMQIVPFDDVGLTYATESDIYPGSAMGHIYLTLQGEAKQDFHKVFSEGNVLDFKKGDYLSYGISFFADADLGINPISYIRAIIGKLNGVYSLSPLDNIDFEYLQNEERTIWRFTLDLDSKEKQLIAAHLWELRDKSIDYSFIDHNCNDALKNILRVANESFFTEQSKPYQTPVEYIQSLQNAGKIVKVETQSPKNKQKFVDKYGYNDIFQTRKSAKAMLGYTYSSGDSLLNAYFAPIYSDMRNVNNAYRELIESRLASVDVAFNLKNNQAFIREVELLHLSSILDFYRTQSLSKYLNISFKNPLQEQRHTRLKPNMSVGGGIGSYIGDMSVYVMPLLGYDYEKEHNAFLDMRAGIVMRFKSARLIGSYDYYVDIKNQRGWKQKWSAFVGFNLYKQWDFFVQTHIHKMINNTNTITLQSGISINF